MNNTNRTVIQPKKIVVNDTHKKIKQDVKDVKDASLTKKKEGDK